MALDGLVYLTIQSFWISVLVGTPTLFFMRLKAISKHPFTLKHVCLILFLPCSMGYLWLMPEDSIKTWYRIAMVVFFGFTFIASLLLFFNHFQPNIL